MSGSKSFEWELTSHNAFPEACFCKNVHRNLTDLIFPFLIIYHSFLFGTWII